MRRSLVVVAVLSLATALGIPAGASDSPDDISSQVDRLATELGVDTTWRQSLLAVIDPDPNCDPNTPLEVWMTEQLAGIAPTTVNVLLSYGVLDWPFFWTLGGDPDPTDDYFGVDGEYTREQLKRQREHLGFWTVDLDHVYLQAAHGEVIANDAAMVRLVSFIANVDEATAQGIVDLVQATIEADPVIGFDHPIFTFNGFAFPEQVVPGLGPLPAKVVMGDGIFAGFEGIGLGDVAPDFILAHEMAHQVQYELGIFSDDTPEGTRRTELMADGWAAYETAHARGATFRTKRLLDAVATPFNSGDCAFDDPNHHGTPDQRRRSASWGIDLANVGPKGMIIPAQELPGLFDQGLPSILSG